MGRDPKEMTKAERVQASYMADALHRIEREVLRAVTENEGLPQSWHEVATQPSPGKYRVTMCLDVDVVKFFKAMGPGYQTKINLLLRAWMHGRLAKVIKGPDATDIVLRPAVVAEQAKRDIPWGEMADALEQMRLMQEQEAYWERNDEALVEAEGLHPELREKARERIEARKKGRKM
ncbi:MAG: BrnA antitoxin family protein [Pseudomonadota bacterium]